jgi:hypothetical protein
MMACLAVAVEHCSNKVRAAFVAVHKVVVLVRLADGAVLASFALYPVLRLPSMGGWDRLMIQGGASWRRLGVVGTEAKH